MEPASLCVVAQTTLCGNEASASTTVALVNVVYRKVRSGKACAMKRSVEVLPQPAKARTLDSQKGGGQSEGRDPGQSEGRGVQFLSSWVTTLVWGGRISNG